jgi:hypothetical protein
MPSYVTSAFLAAAFVLAPVAAGHAAAPSRPPFTVTNDPVTGTVVDTMLSRTCTGTIAPIFGSPIWVRTIFFRKPDGTKWVRLYKGGIGPDDFPVVELGVSAQWTGREEIPRPPKGLWGLTHYALYPDGDNPNHLSGQTVDPYGTIDVTCE